MKSFLQKRTFYDFLLLIMKYSVPVTVKTDKKTSLSVEWQQMSFML